MSEGLIQLACLAILLFCAALLLSIFNPSAFNQGGVMQNGLNATPILETNRGVSVEEYKSDPPPVLNPGKPALPCAACQGSEWTLTDYRDSPTVYGPNGLYKGHFRGDEFIFDNEKIVTAPFRRKR